MTEPATPPTYRDYADEVVAQRLLADLRIARERGIT